LLVLTGLYCLASFTHFFHNAEFCGEYPNLPVWISRSTVYLSWLGITAIGGAGVWFTWSRRPLPGLGLLALYALLGFAGLGHYTRRHWRKIQGLRMACRPIMTPAALRLGEHGGGAGAEVTLPLASTGQRDQRGGAGDEIVVHLAAIHFLHRAAVNAEQVDVRWR
jgi:hypothetical protein